MHIRSTLSALCVLATAAPLAPAATASSLDPLSSVAAVGSSAIKSAFRPAPKVVRYETTTESGALAPVTATLYDRANAKGLVVIAPGTRGMADHCAPSNNTALLSSDTGVSLSIDYERPMAHMLVDAGYRVIVTDYVGLGTPGTHTYLNRVDQGHAVIDAARFAAHDGEKVAFWGYSQGGGASAAAAELVADYAPELNVVAAFVGAPPADPLAVLEQSRGPLISPVAGFAAVSYSSTYPDFREALYAELNEKGVATLDALSKACLLDAMRIAPKEFKAYTKRGVNLAELAHDNPVLRARLDQNKLGRVPTKVPTLVLTNPDDDMVPARQATQLARDYCALGSPVEYRSVGIPGTRSMPLASGSSTTPFANLVGAGHALPIVLETSNVITWLDERFDPNGPVFTPTCNIPGDTSINVAANYQYTGAIADAVLVGIVSVLAAVGLGTWLVGSGLPNLALVWSQIAKPAHQIP
ncbi:lipase family protein [Corynebacterium sp. NML130628]|uniref:lipase family protein n=1 Tax=Corynebacterium sp. NML130628 TaxID=1906333 RepID=UPI0008FB5E7C|nr:lipase family protein [Corynebacterium sp. NML130628]OIR45867.1 hypothetical protein BJP07_02230 [Corynebacterium sp. NML130628]